MKTFPKYPLLLLSLFLLPCKLMIIGKSLFQEFLGPNLVIKEQVQKVFPQVYLYDTIFLLSLRARSCRLIEVLSGTLRTHLFLSSPENNCRPMSAMTPRKNKNKTKTSLKSFNERSRVFTIARRPAKYMNAIVQSKRASFEND